MLRAPFGRPPKTPYFEPSGSSSVLETELSVPMVAVTCSGAPLTESVPVTEVPLKLTDCCSPSPPKRRRSA